MPTVLYDRDCGFCRWSLAKLLAWDRRRALRPVAIQDSEGQRLLQGVPEDERLASWHLVDQRGEVHSAGAGFSPMLRELPGGAPLAALAERVPEPVDRAYRAVASRRSALGPRISERAKRKADRRIAERAGAPPGAP